MGALPRPRVPQKPVRVAANGAPRTTATSSSDKTGNGERPARVDLPAPESPKKTTAPPSITTPPSIPPGPPVDSVRVAAPSVPGYD